MTEAGSHPLIEALIEERPHFHAWPDGRSANWGIAPEVLRFLFAQLKPGMTTLETGAGYTTAAFCIAGTRHLAVTPDEEQAGRIRASLEKLGIEPDLIFVLGSSDIVLPSGQGIAERLDLVSIDGAQRFPFPVIDWYYTESRVPVGGLVVVDDTRMPSVRILHESSPAKTTGRSWPIPTRPPSSAGCRSARAGWTG
jgi:predicted O-methyltransferase YrrM